MKWNKVKSVFPEQWILVEVLETHTDCKIRVIYDLAVVDSYQEDNTKALMEYINLHSREKDRELYVVHTSLPPDITEQIKLFTSSM